MKSEEREYKKYTADEKKALVDKYDIRVGSGQSQQAACADLGVRRTSILYWKSILENGGTLTDTDAGKGHGKGGGPGKKSRPKPGEISARKRTGKYVVVDEATKIAAAQRLLSKEVTAYQLSAELGVHYTTVHQWGHDYRNGKFGKPGKTPLKADPGTQIVTLREAPPPRSNGNGKHAPVQLGLALSESEEVVLLRDEVRRLKAKIRQLMPLVMDE